MERKNMVRRYGWIVLVLLLLAGISGYLMSQPSAIGKVGIGFFYREYSFLRVWWEGAAVVFIVWMILFAVQGWFRNRMPWRKTMVLYLVFIVLGFVGFYFTRYDFTHTLTHRLLKTRFHIGAYLFWVGWVLIPIFFLLQPPPLPKHEEERRHTGVPTP
jgi:hypothetical protein